MNQIRLLTLLTLLAFPALSEAESSPVDTVSKFYSDYLAYSHQEMPNGPRPKMEFSRDFSSVVNHSNVTCKKVADYPCGWGADGDEYLDSQEIDPILTYQNSGIVVSETTPGIVNVKLNVYPSIKNAGNYYLKSITYKMVQESGRWVVDDVIYTDGKSTKQVLAEEAKNAERLYNEEHSNQ